MSHKHQRLSLGLIALVCLMTVGVAERSRQRPAQRRCRIALYTRRPRPIRCSLFVTPTSAICQAARAITITGTRTDVVCGAH